MLNFSDTASWSGQEGSRLIISSAAVRQFFVLKYNIPLGKKSKKIDWCIEITEDNYRNLLSSFVETEGSISSARGQPRFEFKIHDKEVRNACYKCLKKIECSPSKTETQTWNTGIYSIEDCLLLHQFLIKEDKEELAEKLRLKIEASNILEAVKKKSWCNLIDEARKSLSNLKPNQEFVQKHNEIFPENPIKHTNVSSWALEKAPARLSAALLACQITSTEQEEVFEPHIQSYINSSSLEKYVRS